MNISAVLNKVFKPIETIIEQKIVAELNNSSFHKKQYKKEKQKLFDFFDEDLQS